MIVLSQTIWMDGYTNIYFLISSSFLIYKKRLQLFIVVRVFTIRNKPLTKYIPISDNFHWDEHNSSCNCIWLQNTVKNMRSAWDEYTNCFVKQCIRDKNVFNVCSRYIYRKGLFVEKYLLRKRGHKSVTNYSL